MKKLTTRQKWLVIYCGALMICGPFSIDLYLASFPTLQKALHTSHALVQLTLSFYFISAAVGQLVWGPLSDRIGRKKVILMGLLLYVFSSLLCANSHQILTLIIARTLQGFGACAGIVTTLAIAKDGFTNPAQLKKVIGIMMSIALLSPMIAPTIGSSLLIYFGWTSNFYFLALYGSLITIATCFIPESHPLHKRKPLPANQLLHAYAEQTLHPLFFLALCAASITFTILFAWISASPFVYINIYHISPRYFGYFFALNSVALLLGSTSLNYLSDLLNERTLFLTALLFCIITALAMLIAIDMNPHSIWCVAIPSFIMTLMIGILFPGTITLAMKHVLNYTGLTSALVGSSRALFAALIAFVMGVIIKNQAQPLAMTMGGLAIISMLLMLLYYKRFKDEKR